MSIVLMYHALFRGDDTSLIDEEDLPYAVSENDFTAQLDELVKYRVGHFDQTPAPDVVITFDDGHISNLNIAIPLLLQRRLSAIFFVTTDFIDHRRGFMSTEQLNELSGIDGMRVGSHGLSHRFFDDLSDEEAFHELAHSRKILESITNRPCRSISFPGGRYNDQTLSQLEAAGYQQWFGSAVDIVPAGIIGTIESGRQMVENDSLLPQLSRQPLPRVAIRRTTTLAEFSRIIKPDMHYYTQHRRRSQSKQLVRRLIGNRLYHGLYKLISAR